jgi:spermidine/putrescine-binding protein
MRTTPSSRRTFIVTATTAGIAAASTSACQKASASDRQLVFASFSDAQRELDRLSKAATLASAARWSWAQTLTHCAQSIEFSLTGFPSPKSALFQNTAGAVAFQVFSWRGRMSHDLAEPIPGAPPLDTSNDVALAMGRLQKSIADFRKRTEPLHPHFAYGALNKPSYERAHAMHLANHLSGFDTKP